MVGLAFALTLRVLSSEGIAADDAAARERARAKVTEGARLFGAGDATAALQRFQEGYAIFPSPKIFYNIGLAYEQLGQNGSAFMAFERFLREATDASPQHVAHSRKELERLSKRVAFVNLSCDLGDADVILDGRSVGRTPLKSRLPVDTGPHDLIVRRPETGSKSEQFTVVAGQILDLKVELRPSETPPAPARLAPVSLPAPRQIQSAAIPEPIVPRTPDRAEASGSDTESNRGALRTAGWVLAGGALAAAGFAVFETATWISKQNKFDNHVGPRPAMNGLPATLGVDCATNLPNRGYSPECQGIYSTLGSARTLAIVGYVATGLFAGGSALFFSLAGPREEPGGGLSLRCGPALGVGAVCGGVF